MSQSFFVQITPGLEEIVKAELKTFQVRKLKTQVGAVTFEGTRKHLYRVLQWSRCAHRVYWTLGTWSAPQQEALYQKAMRVAWDQILPNQCQIAIKSVVTHSPQTSATQAKELVWHAISKGYPQLQCTQVEWNTTPHSNQSQVQRILVYIQHNRLTLRIDAAGGLMHKRGWRQSDGLAPLRPTLVACILRLIEWKPDIPLIDPMCGSGTWSVEALQQSLKKTPRLWTNYPCQRWKNFDTALWHAATSWCLDSDHSILSHTPIYPSDLNMNMVQITDQHIKKIAPSHHTLHVRQLDIHQLITQSPPCESVGYLVINPPYQIRIKSNFKLIPWILKFLQQPKWYLWTLIMVIPHEWTSDIIRHFTANHLAQFKHGGRSVSVISIQNQSNV